MSHNDRRRLDRVPKPWERWLGIVLSAVIAVLCLPLAVGLLLMARSGELSLSLIGASTLLGVLGLAGLWFLYRLAFTNPASASPQAQITFAWIAVVVCLLLVLAALVRPMRGADLLRALALLCVAATYLSAVKVNIRRSAARENGAL